MSPSCVSTGSPGTVLAIRKIDECGEQHHGHRDHQARDDITDHAASPPLPSSSVIPRLGGERWERACAASSSMSRLTSLSPSARGQRNMTGRGSTSCGIKRAWLRPARPSSLPPSIAGRTRSCAPPPDRPAGSARSGGPHRPSPAGIACRALRPSPDRVPHPRRPPACGRRSGTFQCTRPATRLIVALLHSQFSGAGGFQKVSAASSLPPRYMVRMLTWSIGVSSALMPTRARSDCSFCARFW